MAMVMVPLFEDIDDLVVELPWPKPELRVLTGGLAASSTPAPHAEAVLEEEPRVNERPVRRPAVSARVRTNRRRVLAAAVVSVVLLFGSPVLGLFAHPLAPGQASHLAGGAALRGTWPVVAGDTVQSIAASLSAEGYGPASQLAAAIIAEDGSSVLVPGQRIAIP